VTVVVRVAIGIILLLLLSNNNIINIQAAIVQQYGNQSHFQKYYNIDLIPSVPPYFHDPPRHHPMHHIHMHHHPHHDPHQQLHHPLHHHQEEIILDMMNHHRCHYQYHWVRRIVRDRLLLEVEEVVAVGVNIIRVNDDR